MTLRFDELRALVVKILLLAFSIIFLIYLLDGEWQPIAMNNEQLIIPIKIGQVHNEK